MKRMLQNSSFPGISVEQRRHTEEGGGGPISDGYQDLQVLVSGEDVDRSSGCRWPPEETVALLQIRSDMDVAFRDITPKALLWEQVSRRLGELGYSRSAKKCEEKFKNVFKYYRRTKKGRRGRPAGKTYRFLELLEPLLISTNLEKNEEQEENTATTTTPKDLLVVIQDAIPYSSSTTFFSSEESGENIPEKERKLTQLFERLMNQVVENQEKLQKNLMEMLEKCEQDRIARQEAWKMQELARIKRERDLLAEERSIAAAKDAAVLALLRKFTDQVGPLQLPDDLFLNDKDKDEQENDNAGSSVIGRQECRNGGDFNFAQMSSATSRWPKGEVEALIRLRTNLDVENEGNGLKVSLWEEISCAMKKLGYDRSAKRCKEKWENMNKYFKRIKEKNKKRAEDSKTCPYFHQLDALYQYNNEKPKNADDSAGSGKDELKPEELLMHIMKGQCQSSSEDADREEGSE